MDASFYIILICVFVVVITSLFICELYKFKKSVEKRLKEQQESIVLSFHREKIENDIYEETARLLSTKLRFEETNHLFYKGNDKDITLSEHIKDDSFYSEQGVNLAELQLEKDMIVCLMPFHKTFDNKYSAIKTACKDAGFNCVRSDDSFIVGDILRHTIELILKSQVIIALMDGRNPNVFYEIGIAHSAGKPVILIADNSKIDEIPFNLKSNRFIFYKNIGDLKEQLTRALKSMRKYDKPSE